MNNGGGRKRVGELAEGCTGSTAAPGGQTDGRTDVLVKIKNMQKQEAERRLSGSRQPSNTPPLPSGCTALSRLWASPGPAGKLRHGEPHCSCHAVPQLPQQQHGQQGERGG